MTTTLLSDLAVGARFVLREQRIEDIGREFTDTGRDLGVATVVEQKTHQTVVEFNGDTLELDDRRVVTV